MCENYRENKKNVALTDSRSGNTITIERKEGICILHPEKIVGCGGDCEYCEYKKTNLQKLLEFKPEEQINFFVTTMVSSYFNTLQKHNIDFNQDDMNKTLKQYYYDFLNWLEDTEKEMPTI